MLTGVLKYSLDLDQADEERGIDKDEDYAEALVFTRQW